MTANQTARPLPVRHTSLGTSAGLTWTLEASSSNPGRSDALSADLPSADLLSGGVAATVPGEVHTDLLRAGLIPDPFDGDNEGALSWIGRTDWTYRTSFVWEPGPEARHDLVAEGLDTMATIILNGQQVARTVNQHRSYRLDVGALLRPGANELVIAFEAPVNAAERLAAALGDRPYVNVHPYNGIRKMASAYGWDWGPDLAGAGIWKEIGIDSWSDVRLASVRPLASLDGTDGALQTHLELEWDAGTTLASAQVSVAVAGTDAEVGADVPAGQTHVTLSTRVPAVAAWWPRGYGDQPLYDVSVAVADNDIELSGWRGRVGFRTVTLSTTPDAAGSEYVIAVNGEPVYVKGANWIPDDALLTRLTAQTYRASIQDAVDAGMNLLRVWGGGIYESEHFYATCDELGVLVWQDFLFACAAYSEDEPLWSEVEAEARQAITRLSQHASLAIWNGNNENIWGYVEWNWRSQLGEQSWGDGYYTGLLPSLVAELDPRTPYSAASPYSFAKYHHPNDPRHGTMHEWEVWNRLDYSHYRDHAPRFMSEFGFQGPPAWSTLTSVVHDEPADPYGPQMLVHQKAADGNGKLERGLGRHLPKWGTAPTPAGPAAQMDDWHWLTSLNQARAVSFGILHYRSHYPHNRGAIVWQLNDNWPVISWAAVDGHGIRKPLWHALRRVYVDRLVTVQPRPNEQGVEVPALVAHNDSAEAWSGDFTIRRLSTAAGTEVLAEQKVPFHVAPRSAVTTFLDADVANPNDPRQELIEVTATGAETAYWYFVEDTELMMAPVRDAIDVTVARTEQGYDVTVTAKALAKDLALFPDRLDPTARVSTALVTLTTGQSHTFGVVSAELDEVALTAKPVLRSVNDVIAG